MKKPALSQGGKKLFSNTFMLYLLTFSSQLLNLVTIPYLTRVLGPAVYGKVGLAQAYMIYIQLILDFGFVLSATAKVTRHQGDTVYLSRLFSAVLYAKLALGVLSAAGFALLGLLVPTIRGDMGFFMLYVAATVLNALNPDFFYRGMEDMRVITIRTVAIKALFALLVFVFVKEAAHYTLLPVFQLAGNVVAVLWVLRHAKSRYGVGVVRVRLAEIWAAVKDSAQFFASRIASTAYQATNTVILNLVYGNAPVVGYYTSADKIVTLFKTASSPIADSLYPYMVKHKKYGTVKKIVLLLEPLILAAVVVLMIFAEPFCVLLFGAEFAGTGAILRILLPIAAIILPTYLLCFPVMVPMGLAKYANFSNVVGLCVQVAQLVVLLATGNINVYTICAATTITEYSVFAFRAGVVWLHTRKIKQKGPGNEK